MHVQILCEFSLATRFFLIRKSDSNPTTGDTKALARDGAAERNPLEVMSDPIGSILLIKSGPSERTAQKPMPLHSSVIMSVHTAGLLGILFTF